MFSSLRQADGELRDPGHRGSSAAHPDCLLPGHHLPQGEQNTTDCATFWGAILVFTFFIRFVDFHFGKKPISMLTTWSELLLFIFHYKKIDKGLILTIVCIGRPRGSPGDLCPSPCGSTAHAGLGTPGPWQPFLFSPWPRSPTWYTTQTHTYTHSQTTFISTNTLNSSPIKQCY